MGWPRVRAEKRIVKPDDDPADAQTAAAQAKRNLARLLKQVRQQVKDQQLQRTRQAGASAANMSFAAAPETGGLLIGFDVSGEEGQVAGLRPIFLTERGTVNGPQFGKTGQHAHPIRAKKGYAVAGVRASTNGQLTGFSITFMEIGPEGLNKAKSYESEWIGAKGRQETTMGGTGAPIVGIFGHATPTRVIGLGLAAAAGK